MISENVSLLKNFPNPSGSIIHFATIVVIVHPIAKKMIIRDKFKNAAVKDSSFNFFLNIITAKIKWAAKINTIIIF